jgi:hypothetical protein
VIREGVTKVDIRMIDLDRPINPIVLHEYISVIGSCRREMGVE